MLKAALCIAAAASCVSAAPHQASGMTGVRGSLAFAPSLLPLGRSQHTCVNAATKKNKAPAKAGGFGAATKNGAAARKTSSTATIDAAGLLRKSVDLYESFLAKGTVEQEFDDDVFTEFKEYVVSVRARGAKGADQVSDWVPAALMCVYWQGGQLEDNPLLQGIADHNMACKPALKQMRREVWECACQVSPTLRKVARDAVEYAYEPLDGFHNILEEARSNGGSAAEAYKTLGLSPGAPAAEIKSSHRKLIRSLHPDTLGAMEGEERAAAEERFKRVQNAYEVLGGGQGEEGDSWYASLGGKSRHDTFTGAVRLDDSVGALPSQYWITAVQAVDSDISREFFVRNTARANLAD